MVNGSIMIVEVGLFGYLRSRAIIAKPEIGLNTPLFAAISARRRRSTTAKFILAVATAQYHPPIILQQMRRVQSSSTLLAWMRRPHPFFDVI
jgi:hypothetical protein